MKKKPEISIAKGIGFELVCTPSGIIGDESYGTFSINFNGDEICFIPQEKIITNMDFYELIVDGLNKQFIPTLK